MLLDETPPVDYERRDELLSALARLSGDDVEVGEVLVMCLLPGLKARLRKHSHNADVDEAAAEMVAALWRRIRCCPLDRRHRKIALNLLLDATHDFIEHRDRDRAWAGHELTGDGNQLDGAAADPGVSPQLMWHQARRAGVLNAREVTLIDGTRLRGLPLVDCARLMGMSHDAAKKARRRRGETRFTRWWAPDDCRHAA